MIANHKVNDSIKKAKIKIITAQILKWTSDGFNKDTTAAQTATDTYIKTLATTTTPATSTLLNDIGQADIDYHALTGDNQGKFGSPGDIQTRVMGVYNNSASADQLITLLPNQNQPGVVKDVTLEITNDLTLNTQSGFDVYNPNTKITEKVFKSWVVIDANGKGFPILFKEEIISNAQVIVDTDMINWETTKI